RPGHRRGGAVGPSRSYRPANVVRSASWSTCGGAARRREQRQGARREGVVPMTSMLENGNWSTTTEFKENSPTVPAAAVLEQLTRVIDPELGIDIVNLGMVYVVAVNGADVAIEMTLTTPGCPL